MPSICLTVRMDKPTKAQIAAVMAHMGRKGGPARAAALSAKRRSEIAAAAAKARWLIKKTQ